MASCKRLARNLAQGKFTMAATPPICNFGEAAHDFALPATDGRTYRLADLKGPKGTVIVFMCNHCPYVKAVIDRLIRDAQRPAALGVNTIAISSNDAAALPGRQLRQHEALGRGEGVPVQVPLRREPGGRPRLRRRLHAGLLRLQRRPASCSIAAGSTSRKTTPVPDARRELFEAMKQVAETGRGPERADPVHGLLDQVEARGVSR